ncbi:nucleoside deaminase [Streptomyces scabiei]|uniref:nucleoside deaminase n=1 Tax=Streptomyces scabiei TaxID=1930 RepID=UPI000AE38B77|nr:nucleoside deaminase [Streptomyces scabiei]MDX2830538.1 nucleoside deaminase [Streptomyces scabiei]MDX3673722.1 nucleoside deaminase [Streptomyces scabiei]
MDAGRRRFLERWGTVATGIATPLALPRHPRHPLRESRARTDGGADEHTAAKCRSTTGAENGSGDRTGHERFMRLAVEQARRNPAWPFGAVIVATRTGRVLGSGVNSGADSPLLHGEVVAMNDYVRRHGNRGWAATTLYTTGEPCSMCMSALVWANVRRVVWAGSIEEISRTGIVQIALSAHEVAAAARSFYTPELLLGGVLSDRTDLLFQEARRLREARAAAHSGDHAA